LLLAAALQAGAAPFAPPLDRNLIVTTERVETEGADQRRYTTERQVRFARDRDGYSAEVTILRADGDGPEGASSMFERAYGSLAGRPIRFRLDAAGRVTAIESGAELWDALAEGIVAAMLARRAHGIGEERRTLTASIAAPLRAMPPERQAAMLASLVTTVAPGDARLPAGSGPVHIPGRSPLGGSVECDGTRRVTRTADLVQVETRATGEMQVAGGTARLAIANSTTSDPHTGLLRSGSERSEARIGEGAQARLLVTVTTVRVEQR